MDTRLLLSRAENSDSPELQEKADAVRMKVETGWREARDRELDSADQVMVDRYGNAISLARRYNVSNPAGARATATDDRWPMGWTTASAGRSMP